MIYYQLRNWQGMFYREYSFASKKARNHPRFLVYRRFPFTSDRETAITVTLIYIDERLISPCDITFDTITQYVRPVFIHQSIEKVHLICITLDS